MSQEKIKCGSCGTDNWVDPWKTTSCKKCGSPIKGTKAKITWIGRIEIQSNMLNIWDLIQPIPTIGRVVRVG